MKKKHASPLLLLLLIPLVCAALALALLRPKGDPAQSLQTALASLSAPADTSLTGLDAELADAFGRCLRYEFGPFEQKLRSASGTVTRTALDAGLLTAGLAGEMQAKLNARAAAAKRSAELYTEDGAVLPALCEAFYTEAMEARLSHAEDYCRSVEIPVTMTFEGGEWKADLSAFVPETLPSRPGFEASAAALEPVPLHYTLPRSGPGPVPDPACYGESDDPQVLARLLESPTAQRLINGQKLDFDPARDMLGRPVRWYLDETILALVWQQDRGRRVRLLSILLPP